MARPYFPFCETIASSKATAREGGSHPRVPRLSDDMPERERGSSERQRDRAESEGTISHSGRITRNTAQAQVHRLIGRGNPGMMVQHLPGGSKTSLSCCYHWHLGWHENRGIGESESWHMNCCENRESTLIFLLVGVPRTMTIGVLSRTSSLCRGVTSERFVQGCSTKDILTQFLSTGRKARS